MLIIVLNHPYSHCFCVWISDEVASLIALLPDIHMSHKNTFYLRVRISGLIYVLPDIQMSYRDVS